MRQLNGKVALITGASTGLGKATAMLFAENGARLVLAARRERECQKIVDQICSAGGNAIFVPTDVTQPADCKNAVDMAVEKFGKLDIAFNNAGVFSFGKTVVELSLAEWRQVLEVNLTGCFLSMKYQCQAMSVSGGGSIVNMSSAGGLVGAPGHSAYVASKHGVIGLTKAAALEFATGNIRVNAVCPGVIPTDMTQGWLEKADSELIKASHAVQRFGTAEEVAQTVLFLASDASSFVTGSAMVVDGVYSAH